VCLSNLYLREKKQDNLVMEEGEKVSADNENIQMRTLFGDSKKP
jgi:hypothetical protein